MITYAVREEVRYFVVRTEGEGLSLAQEELGHYTDRLIATEVAYALAEQERKRLGYALGDSRLQFPAPLDGCINGCDGVQAACSECPPQSPEEESAEVDGFTMVESFSPGAPNGSTEQPDPADQIHPNNPANRVD